MPKIKSALLPLFLLCSFSSAKADTLEDGFFTPTDQTRPRCYWYWLDGHISKEGIIKDLESMKRVGIGEGYIGMIDGQSGAKANPNLKPLSDPWWDTIAHAIREGTRLGVDIGVFNSPGWSQSGGPWVKPGQAMRYVRLPEIRLHGPARFDGKLPGPAEFFQDITVTAFPAPAGDSSELGRQTHTPAGVTIEFPNPITARSVKVPPAKPTNVTAELAVSDDGVTYRTLKKFPIDRHNPDVNVGPVPLAPVVMSFPATTGKFFRVTFSRNCAVGDVTVSPAARVESFYEKQLDKVFQDPHPPYDFYTWPLQPEPDRADLIVPVAAVQNLSKSMDADGTLHWDVPAGDWVVQRVGMSPTGSRNSPAPAEATGLEVDKMNRTHLAAHFDSYIGHILNQVTPAERRSWKHVVADSYERGPENWTDGFGDDFRKVYGYDPLPFLPVMSGRVVGSVDQSDRFLWDLRRLIADRIAHDYVGGLAELCHKHDLKMWLENYGHFGFPSEFLSYGGACDEIAGEFWVNGDLGSIELRCASSSAHTYGKNVVWAEAWTGGPLFVDSPRDLKLRGDWAYCQGINQLMLHVYIHQPDEQLPGMSAAFGSEFNRHNTWFEMSKSWIDYQRRCTHLLQQGLHVADVAYFITEDAPKMTGLRDPALPTGYDFDYINAEVLLGRATVADNRLVLPDGMSYAALVLPPNQTMRPELLAKIAEFVGKGLTVVGPMPSRSPSLQNFPACDAEVKRLAATIRDRVTNGPDLAAAVKVAPDVAGLPGESVLFTHRHSAEADIYFLSNQTDGTVPVAPAFRVSGGACELWHPDTGEIERVAGEPVGSATRVKLRLEPRGSIFVVFRKSSPRTVAAGTGALAGKLEIRTAVYEATDGAGSADVTAALAGQVDGGTLQSSVSNESLGGDPALHHPKRLRVSYAVDGKPATAVFDEGAAISLPPGNPVAGPWQLDIASRALPLDTLVSWTDRSEPAVKYFSGTAAYHTHFSAAEVRPRVVLDLGQVDTVAEVTLNGKTFPALWKSPYRVDVTSAIKAGDNQLDVRVANVWHNRLVGKSREEAAIGGPPVYASTTPRYGKNEKLFSSGLIGPVTLRGAEVAK